MSKQGTLDQNTNDTDYMDYDISRSEYEVDIEHVLPSQS